MIAWSYRLAPWALVGLGILVWFGPSLPGYDALEKNLGEEPILRFSVGVLCLYVLALEAGRRHMQASYRDLLQTLRDLAGRGRGEGPGGDDARREAVELLVGALESSDESVRRTAREHLERLTGQRLGDDPGAWRAWLAQDAARES